MSGPDGMPGRRRAVPFEESALLVPSATDETTESTSDELSRMVSSAHGGSAPADGQATGPRPAARPASRPPSLPSGPILLPSAERPAARPPGSRRADVPTLVGGGTGAPAGRRIAVTEEPPAPASAPAPAPAPSVIVTAAPVPAPVPEPVVEVAPPVVHPGPEPVRRQPRARVERQVRPARRASSERLPKLTRAGMTLGWVTVLAVACAGVVLTRHAPDVPDLIRQASAGAISVALAWALAVRTGGRPIWAAALTAALAVGAFTFAWEPLVAGASVGTGVLAATLAVMATTPAATFSIAIREVVIATSIAWVGAVGVLGYGPDARPEVDSTKVGYVVLGLSLAGAFALVYRLGAGLHGLGRRGYVVAGGAVLMLAIAMAYTEAIAAWGSRDLVGSIDDVRDSVRSALGAVPHPIVALLGYPALVWGVFMRARRRQGWWVCAFGVAATAPATTRLVTDDLSRQSVVLGAVYSFVLGIAIGYLVIRVEQSLTGSHGRRARRDEEAVAHRPEPSRTRPLH